MQAMAQSLGGLACDRCRRHAPPCRGGPKIKIFGGMLWPKALHVSHSARSDEHVGMRVVFFFAGRSSRIGPYRDPLLISPMAHALPGCAFILPTLVS
mgnify:CR=1 FL=1